MSPFTLGTMRAVASPQAMEAVVLAALAAGINHLETAPAYGPAETFLGQVLRGHGLQQAVARGELVVTSKLLPGLSFEEGRQQLQQCLQRLGLPQLPNLAVHGLNRPDHLAWALEGAGADLLAWAEDEGLVGQVGFSSHGSNGLIAAALSSGRFGFCSLHLHLFDPQRLPLAQQALAQGLGVLAISPADKGGRLYAPPAQLRADCSPFEPLELAYRFLLEQGISTLSLGAQEPGDLAWARRLAATASDHGPASPGEGGRSAAQAPGPAAAAVTLTSTSEGSPPPADPGLSPAVAAAVERLRAAQAARLGAEHCGQCQACLPCPNAVPIPALLRLRNLALGHGMEAYAQERYNLIGRAGHWWEEINAEACGRCGACLPRCPQQLPIPDLLTDTHRRLAAAPRRRLWG